MSRKIPCCELSGGVELGTEGLNRVSTPCVCSSMVEMVCIKLVNRSIRMGFFAEVQIISESFIVVDHINLVHNFDGF